MAFGCDHGWLEMKRDQASLMGCHVPPSHGKEPAMCNLFRSSLQGGCEEGEPFNLAHSNKTL